MKGVFYFDSQPPLGKQLIAAIGYLAGFDGNNAFNEIGGSEYHQKSKNTTKFINNSTDFFPFLTNRI